MIAITIEAFEPVSIDRNIELKHGGPINGKDWKFRKARHIEEDVRREPEGVFVALHLEQVVGYITTWHDADSGVGYIPNLAVTAELPTRSWSPVDRTRDRPFQVAGSQICPH